MRFKTAAVTWDILPSSSTNVVLLAKGKTPPPLISWWVPPDIGLQIWRSWMQQCAIFSSANSPPRGGVSAEDANDTLQPICSQSQGAPGVPNFFATLKYGLIVFIFLLGSTCTKLSRSYCWCFRNPIPNHLGWCWNLVNNGINYQPQLVLAGFLNHQQYLVWVGSIRLQGVSAEHLEGHPS